MPNRIKLALAMYGNVDGDWVIEWMKFQAQLAAYGNHFRGLVLMKGSCYVHMNCNQLASAALDDPSWDYVLYAQQDQVMPDGLLERIGTYREPVVGIMTFGRVMEHQQAVPGRFDANGNFSRLEDEDAEALLDRPGLHPIGAVGLGCTAIRRDVLEKWDVERGHWFQVPTWKEKSWGEDVWFCHQAQQQGWGVFVDTTLVSSHIGTWKSNDQTFRARVQFDRRLRALQEAAAV